MRRCHKKHVKHHTISPHLFVLQKCENSITQRTKDMHDHPNLTREEENKMRRQKIEVYLNHKFITYRQCMLNFLNLCKKAGFINERQFCNTLQNSWYKLLEHNQIIANSSNLLTGEANQPARNTVYHSYPLQNLINQANVRGRKKT